MTGAFASHRQTDFLSAVFVPRRSAHFAFIDIQTRRQLKRFLPEREVGLLSTRSARISLHGVGRGQYTVLILPGPAGREIRVGRRPAAAHWQSCPRNAEEPGRGEFGRPLSGVFGILGSNRRLRSCGNGRRAGDAEVAFKIVWG